MKRTYYCYCAKRCFASFFLLFMSLVVQAQTVGGTVTDEAGVPLPGATVVVLETNQGTTTDFDALSLLIFFKKRGFNSHRKEKK